MTSDSDEDRQVGLSPAIHFAAKRPLLTCGKRTGQRIESPLGRSVMDGLLDIGGYPFESLEIS
jgi:hypothetical protein